MATFAFTPVISSSAHSFPRRSYLLLLGGLLLLCGLIYFNIVLRTNSQALLPSTPAISALAAKHAALQSNPSSPVVTASPTTAKSCTPSSYALPTNLDLRTSPAGYSEVIEPVQTYTVYGTDGTMLRRQIQACAPRENASDSAAEFTAETGYSLSWQYSYALQANGSCVVVSPQIGLHVAMVLPAWGSGSTASTSFAGEWQTFLTNLTTHENGHVALDRQYADQLLGTLQNFPATNCGSIEQSVNAAMQRGVASLNAANDQYDTTTNHGATQGAVLPQ